MKPELSTDAKRVLDQIGEGMRLRTNSLNGIALVEGLRRAGRNRPEIPVSGIVEKIPRDTLHQKIGYVEAGLDGSIADFWRCIQ